MTPRARTAVLFMLLGLPARGQPCDYTDANNAVRSMLVAHPAMEGAALLVGDADGTLHEAYFGSYTADTVVPVASATKLLSGTAIMMLIDSGALDPDAPVRTYLPDDFSFANAGLKATMTVRQMFAHIAGLPGEDATSPILSNTTITLEEAARQIACCVALEDTPGDSFAYGGLSMQVGGRVAEVVSGEAWETFFTTSLSGPLGLTTIDYQGLGPTTNPRIAGGAQSNLRDYGRVLRLLVRGGEIDGVRLLSEQGVHEMMIDQTAGLPRRSPPPDGAQDWGYAFGGWVSRKDASGETTEFTSPGAFGFTPWVDVERGMYGIVMVHASRALLAEELDAIKLALQEDFDACSPRCPADLAPANASDGVLNFFDVSHFLSLYNAGDPGADFYPLGGDGRLDFFDVSAFLSDYNAGCL